VPRRARPSPDPGGHASKSAQALSARRSFQIDHDAGAHLRRTRRVFASRRARLGRDVADRGGSVKFGLVPGHRGGDGEASPGAVCGDRHDARRVLTQRGGCGTDGVMVQYSPEGQWFGFKGKRKVPAREFRVAREIRRFEFLPRPTRGFWVKNSCVRNTPRQFDRLRA
jgi:hypothetical protein